MSCTPDPEHNFQKASEKIRQAARDGAEVVCLQELFRSLYFCQKEDAEAFNLAEPIPGPTSEAFACLSKELNIVIIASLFEQRARGLYHNTVAIIDPVKGLAGRYRKMHIPDDPFYYEKYYFTPGDLGFQSHATDRGNLGVLICWDQWFPEAARLTALAGADILFYPTAIGWIDGDTGGDLKTAQPEAWRTIQRAHAVANGVFVAAVNRVGREGSLTFWGQSFVCDPFGRIVAEASADKEEIFITSCDFSLIEQPRRNWPFLRDRRIDSYGGLGVRFLDRT
ncbi:MAG: carbon-nitrogen hydrolase [Acidobacteria bacterium]|nr:MAG: carbon-nitrogen hydrolase [Acidobacteriota bacterium]